MHRKRLATPRASLTLGEQTGSGLDQPPGDVEEGTVHAIVVIPARYDSSRLPGKVLAPLSGRPMIQHVWERASRSSVQRVLVATDDLRVAEVVRGFGGEVVMTAETHPSGSDRVYEAIQGQPCEIVVNVQGDEPLLDPALVDRLVQALEQDHQLDVATPAAPLHGDPDRPSVVKVVADTAGRALYFSRAAIPHGGPWLHHLGVYAFRRDALERYVGLPRGPLEQGERLEQLRLLEHGLRIGVVLVEQAQPSVDTPEDLTLVRSLLASHP